MLMIYHTCIIKMKKITAKHLISRHTFETIHLKHGADMKKVTTKHLISRPGYTDSNVVIKSGSNDNYGVSQHVTYTMKRLNNKYDAVGSEHMPSFHRHLIYTVDSILSPTGIFNPDPATWKRLYRGNWRKRRYKKVVVLGGKWSGATYHYVIDWLSSLWELGGESVSDLHFLLPRVSSYTKQWLKIVCPGVTDKQILACDWVVADEAFVIEHTLGNRSKKHIDFLRKRVLAAIGDTVHAPQDYMVLSRRRNGKRALKNHDEIELVCKKYADENNLKLIIHDDANLPTVVEQLAYFNKAKVVVGPHGAGFTNIIACRPGTHMLEMKWNSPQHFVNMCRCLSMSFDRLKFEANGSILASDVEYALNNPENRLLNQKHRKWHDDFIPMHTMPIDYDNHLDNTAGDAFNIY